MKNKNQFEICSVPQAHLF